jgi:DNA-binding transcriptional ArsR family regulator
MSSIAPDYDLEDVRVVSSPQEIRALVDPLRSTLLDLLLERAATVSELAAAVDRPKSTVAHHVAVLMDADLLTVVRTRKVRAIEERFYGRTARVFYVGVIGPDEVQLIANDLSVAAVESGPAHKADELWSILRHVRIPRERAAEFWQGVLRLAIEFGELPRSGDEVYGFVAGLYRTEYPTLPEPGRLPAPGFPFGEVGTFGAERGVTAVARVHPGLVGQAAEQLRADVAEQRREPLRVLLRVADAAGEQAVAGEQVRGLAVRLEQQRDRAGGVTDQVDGGQLDVTDPDRVAVVDQVFGRHRDAVRVGAAGVGGRAGRLDDGAERLPVVAVLMRGDHGGQLLAGEVQQRVGFIGGIDEHLLAGRRGAQQVRVVVHWPDSYFGQGYAVDLACAGRSADLHVSCVRIAHLFTLSGVW